MMLSENGNLTSPTPPVGVIESLTQGFETVAGHLALLLLPLLLDIFLWAGPRVSFDTVIQTISDTYYHDVWTPFVVSVNPEMEGSWDELSKMLEIGLGGRAEQYFPLVPFIAIPMLSLPGVPSIPIVGVPSLMAMREARPLPFNYTPPVWEIQSVTEMLGVRLLAVLGGLVLGSVYMALIARQTRGESPDSKPLFARLPVIIPQLFVFGIIAPLLLFVLFMPFLMLAVGLNAISIDLARVAVQLGFALVMWIGLFGVFTIHGMLTNGRGLLGAIWDSVRLVQWNMAATPFLIMLALLLNWALTTFVWTLADTGSWLALVAMGGHAFISTGLITATFVFYKDRYRYWHEMREALLAELERKRAQLSE
jgi:hypothetical protein